MIRGRPRWLVVVGLLQLSAPSVRAAPQETTAIHARRAAVLVDDDDPLARRIAAEFEFLGFEPVLVDGEPPQDPSQLEAVARSQRAALAVLVVEHAGDVELWLADRITGKFVIRHLRLGEQEATRTVAVRVVELLRASLLELERDPDPPGREAPTSAASRAALRPARPRFGATLGAAVVGAGGGLGPAAQLRATFRWMPHRNVGWQIGGAAPLSAARVRADEGEARVRVGWVTSGLRVALRPDAATVRPDLSMVAGVVALGMTGAARAPYTSGRDVVVTGIAEVSAGLEFAVSSRVRLRVAAAVGSCFTRPEVRFAGRTVAWWCLPYGAGEAGLGVVW